MSKAMEHKASFNAPPLTLLRKYFSTGNLCNQQMHCPIHMPVTYPHKIKGIFFILIIFFNGLVTAQTFNLDKKKFFTDESIIEMSLVADFKKLIKEKLDPNFKTNFLPATITCLFPDSSKITEQIEIRPRGEFRREECYLPSIMLNFKTAAAVKLKKLGRMKLVWPCSSTTSDEQLVLKEYLVYKMYNLITEKSFRVRLVKLAYRDVKDKLKPQDAYAFFIEDTDEMAARNKCIEIQSVRFHTEATERKQTTLVAIFQYMIGNTDWSVPLYRNIKLMQDKKDNKSMPFLVPYDFDYSGMVNARYAVPPPELPISTVQQRLYRGFPRSFTELDAALKIFRNQKQAIDSLIQHFEPLNKNNKKEMIKYLDEFYSIIEKEKNIKDIFITNARVE
jgi:hypothetical protein